MAIDFTLADFVLNKGQIMLTQISPEDYEIASPPNNSSFIYGNVEKANDLSDAYQVNQKVMFNAGDAISIVIEDVTYLLTTENNVSSTLLFNIETP